MVAVEKSSKPAVAIVSLIALQSTFYVVPVYTVTTTQPYPMTVLDDWVLDQGHVTMPPSVPVRVNYIPRHVLTPRPRHRAVKPWLWAYLGTMSLSLLLWAAGRSSTRNPSLYTALIGAVFAAYIVDAIALYVAQVSSVRGSEAELGVQALLLLAWPVVPLLVEAGADLAKFVT